MCRAAMAQIGKTKKLSLLLLLFKVDLFIVRIQPGAGANPSSLRSTLQQIYHRVVHRVNKRLWFGNK